MVINNKTEDDITALLLNAKETVRALENTTGNMHNIISTTATPLIQTRSPIAAGRLKYDSLADQLITFILVWTIVFSFITISFYYFTKNMTSSVAVLTVKVEELHAMVELQERKRISQTTCPRSDFN